MEINSPDIDNSDLIAPDNLEYKLTRLNRESISNIQ